MREIRQSGSEGGAVMSRPYPYRDTRVLQEAQKKRWLIKRRRQRLEPDDKSRSHETSRGRDVMVWKGSKEWIT